MFAACIAPQSAWTETPRGFPRYSFGQGETEITITLRSDTVLTDDNLAAMWSLRDHLSIEDWDVLVVLMARVLRAGNPEATAGIGADDILDERKRARTTKGRYTAGHHAEAHAKVAACVNRLTHLHVRARGLEIRVATDKGVRQETVDLNEQVLHLVAQATPQGDDQILAWDYRFGSWLTTFLREPNRQVAYLPQRALIYNPRTQPWSKRLAYYLALHLRLEARRGPIVQRKISTLLEGCHMPLDTRNPWRTRQRVEDAIRQLVQDGLVRLEWQGTVLDASSAELSPPRTVMPDPEELIEAVTACAGAPPVLLVLDYLQTWVKRAPAEGEADLRQRIDRFTAALRTLAERHHCAVLAISSMNRAGYAEGGSAA